MRSEEDRAQRLLEGEAPGFLALLYKLLYQRGLRIGTADAAIAAWRRTLPEP